MKKYTSLSLEQYLNELSSDAAIPGGGSVSAYVASLGMALTQMVGRIALKRKIKEGLSPEDLAAENQKRETIQKIIEAVEKAKRDAFQIVNLDPEVYEEVMKTWGDEQKQQDSLGNSFRLQADLALLIVMANEWNRNMAELVSGSIKNDLLVSASTLEAAFRGAYHTAMINVKYMKDDEKKAQAERALGEAKSRFEKGEAHVG